MLIWVLTMVHFSLLSSELSESQVPKAARGPRRRRCRADESSSRHLPYRRCDGSDWVHRSPLCPRLPPPPLHRPFPRPPPCSAWCLCGPARCRCPNVRSWSARRRRIGRGRRRPSSDCQGPRGRPGSASRCRRFLPRHGGPWRRRSRSPRCPRCRRSVSPRLVLGERFSGRRRHLGSRSPRPVPVGPRLVQGPRSRRRYPRSRPPWCCPACRSPVAWPSVPSTSGRGLPCRRRCSVSQVVRRCGR